MKLKLIQRKPGSPRKGCQVSFQKNGYIRFTKKAVEEHQVKEGMCIAILQDEDKPNDFYLILSEEEKENWPQLRKDSKRSALLCGYTDAKMAIKNHFGIEEDGFSVSLGGKIKTEYGPAICMITGPFVGKKKEGSNG